MRKTRLLGTLGAGLVLAAGATTFALAQSSPDAKIDACVAKDGDVRIVSAGEACKSGETAVNWNVTGPQGQPGASGAAGAAGEPGAAGPAGRDGRDGAPGGGGGGIVVPRAIGTITIDGQIQGQIKGG